MWRVTFTAAGDSQTVPVDPAALAEDVAAILEVELRGAVLAASMAWDGVPVASLPPGTRMSATRVRDGAVVVVTSTKSYASRTPAPSAAAGRLNLRGLLRGGGGGGSRVDPALYATVRRLEDLPPAVLGSVDGLFAVLKANEAVRDDVRRRGDHELLAAAAEATPAKLRALVMSRQLQHVLPAVQERVDTAHLQRRLDADPLDADGQRMLEEMIRRRNVDSNLEMADDVMPEAQVKVHMLYVAAKVNDAPIKIFVDSGAQMTIITKSAAEAVGLTRLMDTRFAGMAVGVGTAKILGRVHLAQLELGGTRFPCAFTVLDQDVGPACLLGLDMLKRFQCCIDLSGASHLRLRVGADEVTVPFLPERELPGAEGGGGDAFGEAAAGAGAGGGARSGVGDAAGASAPSASAGAPSARGGNDVAIVGDAPAAPAAAAAAGAGAGGAGPGPAAGGTAAAAGAGAPVPLFDLASLGARVRPPGPTGARAGVPTTPDEDKVAALMAMGFGRAKVVQALALTGGVVELAASLLPDL